MMFREGRHKGLARSTTGRRFRRRRGPAWDAIGLALVLIALLPLKAHAHKLGITCEALDELNPSEFQREYEFLGSADDYEDKDYATEIKSEEDCSATGLMHDYAESENKSWGYAWGLWTDSSSTTVTLTVDVQDGELVFGIKEDSPIIRLAGWAQGNNLNSNGRITDVNADGDSQKRDEWPSNPGGAPEGRLLATLTVTHGNGEEDQVFIDKEVISNGPAAAPVILEPRDKLLSLPADRYGAGDVVKLQLRVDGTQTTDDGVADVHFVDYENYGPDWTFEFKVTGGDPKVAPIDIGDDGHEDWELRQGVGWGDVRNIGAILGYYAFEVKNGATPLPDVPRVGDEGATWRWSVLKKGVELVSWRDVSDSGPWKARTCREFTDKIEPGDLQLGLQLSSEAPYPVGFVPGTYTGQAELSFYYWNEEKGGCVGTADDTWTGSDAATVDVTVDVQDAVALKAITMEEETNIGTIPPEGTQVLLVGEVLERSNTDYDVDVVSWGSNTLGCPGLSATDGPCMVRQLHQENSIPYSLYRKDSSSQISTFTNGAATWTTNGTSTAGSRNDVLIQIGSSAASAAFSGEYKDTLTFTITPLQ